MELEKMKRKTIKRLKQIKQEQGLSISQIMDLMEKQGKDRDLIKKRYSAIRTVSRRSLTFCSTYTAILQGWTI